MAHDEWKERRTQNIRETALQISKEIHVKNMMSMNKNIDLDEENMPADTVLTEEVIEDADMIADYIKNKEKVYKD